MTAVIAYQSLNSNCSSEHGLDASTSQPFLRKAQDMLATLYRPGSGALNYPAAPMIEPHVAVQGPAELVPVAKADFMNVDKLSRKRKGLEIDDESEQTMQEARVKMLSMVEGKARQIYQHSFREFGEQCDLVAFGELDSAHPDWHTLGAAAGKSVHVSSAPKACNCFSLHSSGATVKATPLAEGTGWCAVRCNGVLVVFVHVPNDVARERPKAIKFYNDIGTALLTASGGGVIDVVMGDTNQSSPVFSPEVISAGLGGSFKDGHGTGLISGSDTWSDNKVVHKGTNSVNDKKFDVAVYNTTTVATISVCYLTQFSIAARQAAAYTDHMGLLVKVTKK